MSWFDIDSDLPEDSRLLHAQEVTRTLARFRAKVYQDPHPTPAHRAGLGSCQLWAGAYQQPSERPRKAGGPRLPYGRFKFQGKVIPAHVFAFAAHHKRDPATLGLIAHECDNPLCVRPSHLKETVPTVNNREAYARGRKRVTVPQRRLEPAYCQDSGTNWAPGDKPYMDVASVDGQIWDRVPASSVDVDCPILPKLQFMGLRPTPLGGPACAR